MSEDKMLEEKLFNGQGGETPRYLFYHHEALDLRWQNQGDQDTDQTIYHPRERDSTGALPVGSKAQAEELKERILEFLKGKNYKPA